MCVLCFNLILSLATFLKFNTSGYHLINVIFFSRVRNISIYSLLFCILYTLATDYEIKLALIKQVNQV